MGNRYRFDQIIYIGVLSVFAVVMSACQATSVQIIPTDPPTVTPTYTPSPTLTPDRESTPTPPPTRVAQLPGQPSPTPLLGATRTPLPADFVTPTPRPANPNAPRIEFFTSDPLAVQPGGTVTLFWSARGVDSAVIYRLDRSGQRTRVYNVPPDGNLPVQTLRSDRGQLDFLITVGEGSAYTEQPLTIPLRCPVEWFFAPAPEDCPTAEPAETTIIDQTFDRGRMLYVAERDSIFVLFNDGQEPAWLMFENRYDPEVHPERDEGAPPQWIQPLRELGLLWRTNDVVRTRLGLGTAEAVSFQGFVQTAPSSANTEVFYISGADGNVLQVIPGGRIWQIIAT